MHLDGHLSRYFRPFKSLPELWFVLILLLLLSILRPLVPPQFHQSLGWTINPYQVFAVVTALAIFMLPGALIVRILGAGGTWMTRLPTYFATAVGAWTIPTLWVAFSERYDIKYLVTLGAIMIILLAVAAYLKELIKPAHPDKVFDEGRVDSTEALNPFLVFIVAAILISAVVISFTAPVALDDNLQVMYVQEDLVVPKINEFEPVFGAGIAPQTRGSLTTWPLNLTVMTYFSGLPPQQAFWLLRTPLVLLDLLAVYALSLQLFGKRNLALFCVIIYFILTLIYTADSDGIGFGLYARGAQDKFVARYSLFPIALAWSMAYLKKPNYRAFWLAGACTIGLSTTHPIGVILLGIPLGGMGLLHLFNYFTLGRFSDLRHPGTWIRKVIRDNWLVIRPLLFLSVFSLIGVIVPLLQQASPDAPIVAYTLTDTRDPTLWFRVNLAINSHRLYIADYLGPGAYIVHPSVFLDPYILLPLIGLPILFIFWRKRWVSELIIGSFLLNPALLLIPPLVQLIGSRATPWLLYRFAWPLALLGPLAICWAVWEFLETIQKQSPFKLLYKVSPVLVLLLTVILLNKDIDRGLTILREQKTDTVSAHCRTFQPLFSKLPGLVGEGAVILSTPENDLCIPSSSAYAYPVEFGLTTTINRFPASRVSEAIQRMNDVLTFIYADTIDQKMMDILTRWNVNLILLRADHPLVSQLQGFPQYFKLELVEDRYMVFRVLPGIGTDILQGTPIKDRWKAVSWKGDNPLIAANTAWSEERWGDAIRTYQDLEQQNGGGGALDLIGLGRAQLSAGNLDDALQTFLRATEKYPDSVQAWMQLGNMQFIKSDFLGMANSYQQVLKVIDWHPLALSRLADAYRLLGIKDLAKTYYELSISADNTPGTSLYYRALGSAYLDVNWNEEAKTELYKSLSIRESLLAYSLLSQIFLNDNDLAQAQDVAYQSKALDNWSDLYSVILGQVELAKLNFAGAVDNFKAAIANNAQSSAYDYLSMTLSSVQEHQVALDQITSTIGFKLGFAEPVLSAAQMQFSMGQLKEAVDLGEQAYGWKPVDPQAVDLLGNIFLATGNWNKAHENFKSALTLNPSDNTAYSGLITLSQLKGQTGPALGWSWESMVSTPNNSDAFIKLGMVSEIQGDTAESLERYQGAIATSPFSPQSYTTLGDFQVDNAQFNSAMQSFNQAIEIRGDTTSAYRGLSEANTELGLVSEALQLANQAVQLHPAEGSNRISTSQSYVQAGDYTGAINTLQQSTVLDPGYQRAYMSLGGIYISLGKTSEAEGIYQRLIQLMPYYEDGYLGLGQLYERMGNTNGAIAVYEKGLDQVASHISGNISLALGSLYLRQGDSARALELYKNCISQQPMLAAGYTALSNYYVSQGEWLSAREILEQGMTLMPTSPLLTIALGNVHISQGEGGQAEELFKKVMSIAPDPGLAVSQSQLAVLQGQPSLALDLLKAARDRWPGNTSILNNGITLAISLGKPADAVSMANDLVVIAPGIASSWISMGDAYSAQAQFDVAELAYRRAITVAPGDSNAELALGSFLSSHGENEQAKQAINVAMEINQKDVAPHLILASILIKEGNTQTAISELQTAADLDSTQNSALLTIGLIYQQEGDFSNAFDYFNKALDVSPASPEVYQAQSQTYLIQGDPNEARQSLIKATQVASGNCWSYIYLGDFQAARGEYSDSEASYDHALGLVGCNGPAHLGLGMMSQILGRTEQADAEYSAVIAAEPGNAQGYIAAAKFYRQQARVQDSETLYDRGMKALPSSASMNIAYTSGLLDKGDIGAGILAAQNGVQVAPVSATYLMLGQAYQLSGQYDDANAFFIKASQADRMDSAPLIFLGGMAAKLSQFDQAQAYYQQAIDVSPTDPQGYVSLGKLLIDRGQPDEGLQILDQGISANQNRNQALMAQVQYYLQVGKLDEASTAISKAFSSDHQVNVLDQNVESLIADNSLESESASIWISLGNLYRLETNWTEAEAAYQHAIDTAPGFANGYVILGKIYQAQGKYPEAQAQFEHATSISPGEVAAYVALGDLFTIQANFSSAEQAYLQAINASPGREDAYTHLAILYITQKRSLEAWNKLMTAVDVAPASPSVWLGLGDWYASQGNTEQATQSYQNAIKFDPSSPTGYVALGVHLQNTGDRGAALDMFQKAITVAPYSKSGYLALANWYLIEGNLASAEANFKKARDLDSADVDGWVGLGYIYLAQGRPSESLSIFKAAQAFYPSDTRTYVGIGDWYISNIDPQASKDQADAQLASAQAQVSDAQLGQAPDQFIEYVVTGIENLQAGNIDEAYNNFDIAIAMNPDSVLPYLAMGQWYRLIMGDANAEQAYEQATNFAPGDIQGRLKLGELYMLTGRNSLALEQFTQASEIAPGLALPHIYMGDFYQGQGDWQTAEAEYKTAIELEPGSLDARIKLANLYDSQGMQQEAVKTLESAMHIGLSSEVSVCAPGQLPQDQSGSESTVIYSSYAIPDGSWYCHWDQRPWSSAGDSGTP